MTEKELIDRVVRATLQTQEVRLELDAAEQRLKAARDEYSAAWSALRQYQDDQVKAALDQAV